MMLGVKICNSLLVFSVSFFFLLPEVEEVPSQS